MGLGNSKPYQSK